jgi:hypothetical protein
MVLIEIVKMNNSITLISSELAVLTTARVAPGVTTNKVKRHQFLTQLNRYWHQVEHIINNQELV